MTTDDIRNCRRLKFSVFHSCIQLSTWHPKGGAGGTPHIATASDAEPAAIATNLNRLKYHFVAKWRRVNTLRFIDVARLSQFEVLTKKRETVSTMKSKRHILLEKFLEKCTTDLPIGLIVLAVAVILKVFFGLG